jgi:serine/threonine protein kinase
LRKPKFNLVCKPVGSLDYQAPEVLKHRKHTYAVDVFAIGAILYRMLLGKSYSLPRNTVSGKNDVEIKVRISEMGVELLNRALDSNPATRISMSELAIHPFLVEGPIAGNLSWTSILEKPAPKTAEDNAHDTKQDAIDKVKSVEGQVEGEKVQLEVPKSQDENDETKSSSPTAKERFQMLRLRLQMHKRRILRLRLR